MSKTKTNKQTLDPKGFDLDLFLKGSTPATAFVTVYGDRKAASELEGLRVGYEKARVEEKDNPRTYGLGEASPADKLREQYLEKREALEQSKVEVEVRELLGSVRAALRNEFQTKHRVTDEEIQADPEGLGTQLDYWVLAKGIVYPPLETAENVERFREAIGDKQWEKVLDAWIGTLSLEVSRVAELTPDFLLESSLSDGGDK